ncbi:MAG: hypothetical protein KBA31_00695 [Alphaproteobacteria bacterium]|nr:hypothetical protein [Alphaproteobacteria bacterium]
MSTTLIPPDFERAIALGLSRAPGKVAETAALATLALLAQQKRHRRFAQTPTVATRARLHEDKRPTVPEPARRPLLRLAASLPKEGWSFLGDAIFDHLDQRGVRLHPFDLPRLEALLQACPTRLGHAERTWLTLRRPAPETPPADTPANSEADWALLPKAQKAAVIRQMRQEDADAARGWVERHIATAPADVRAVLIEALEVGLGSSDAPLLERLAKEDRATSVKDAATELLAATRGSTAYEAKVARAAALVETVRTFVGRRTLKLNNAAIAKLVDLPANASTGTRNLATADALHRTFRNLAFSDIAKALNLSPEDFAAAVAGDEGLAALLAVAALTEGDPATTSKLLPHLTKLGLNELVGRFGSALLKLPSDTRATILQSLTPNLLQWRWADELRWLGHMSGGAVSDAIARKLLSGGVWRAADAPRIDATTLALFAALMPPGRDADFAAAIADLPRKETAAAYEFIAFTTALGGPKE